MFIILSILCQPPTFAQQPHTLSFTPLVFRNVSIINVTATDLQHAILPNQTVVISAGRITAVGDKVRIPDDSQVVEASGKFLIPGLWDMHVHSMYEGRPEFFFPLLIANGVTGVRELASTLPLDTINRIRQEIAKGKILGPRFGGVTGKIIESHSQAGDRRPEFDYVAGVEEARLLVRSRKEQGADFIKVYNWLPRDVYFAIADEAKKHDLPFVGHIPVFVTPAEISAEGQKSVEHLSGVSFGLSSREEQLRRELMESRSRPMFSYLDASVTAVETYDEKKAAALFEQFRQNGTWHCPTYALRRARAFINDSFIKDDPRLKYIPLSVRERWAKGPELRNEAAFRKVYLKELQLAGAMQKAGVRLLAGTDTGFGNFYTIPGFSLHDELELLVLGGLDPLEALQTATLNPAKFFEIQKMHGTIDEGKAADLVLLDANPLEDIGNTRTIAAVVVNGRYLPKSELQRILSEVELAASKK